MWPILVILVKLLVQTLWTFTKRLGVKPAHIFESISVCCMQFLQLDGCYLYAMSPRTSYESMYLLSVYVFTHWAIARRLDSTYSLTVGISWRAVSSSRSHSSTYSTPCSAPIRLGRWVLLSDASNSRHTGSAVILSWHTHTTQLSKHNAFTKSSLHPPASHTHSHTLTMPSTAAALQIAGTRYWLRISSSGGWTFCSSISVENIISNWFLSVNRSDTANS